MLYHDLSQVKEGDVLKRLDEEIHVLGVCGKVVFTGDSPDSLTLDDYPNSFHDLEQAGWRLSE